MNAEKTILASFMQVILAFMAFPLLILDKATKCLILMANKKNLYI